MKLTYWCSRQDNDAQCYNIRAKTCKEVERMIAIKDTDENPYSEPFKVEVEYGDGFDLLSQCLNEFGVYEYSDEWNPNTCENDRAARRARARVEAGTPLADIGVHAA